ncbi:hypothetical protein GF351_05155 [Candidatus Woesearchaeota archaeon]|nr:hypothetical protein [Candidatus Woesearchaeota archaeon]
MITKNMFWQFVAVFCIELMLFLPFHAADVFGAQQPKISNINVDVRSTSADVIWTTDIPASTYVEYSANMDYLNKFEARGGYSEGHLASLTGLQMEAQYFYRIRSCDQSASPQGCSETDVRSFTTLGVVPPEKVAGLRNVSLTRTEVELEWNQSRSDVFAHYLVYRDSQVAANISSVSMSYYTDSSLEPGTSYVYEVSAVNTDGEEGEKAALTVSTAPPDTTPPTLSNITRSSITETAATISWKTDEPSTTTLLYGNTSALGQNFSIQEYVTEHSAAISGLTNDTEIFFMAESCDQSGNCARSSVDSFVTGAFDTEPPFLDIEVPDWHNSGSIDLTGTTEPRATVRLYVNGVYRRMLSRDATADGTVTLKGVRLNTQLATNSLYFVAEDAGGNTADASYNISVDVKPPVLTIGSIPEKSTAGSVTINGTVSEPCTVEFYSSLTEKEDTSPPARPSNLSYTDLGPNSVTLRWDEVEDDDLDFYMIYRSDVGPIAYSSTTSYTDSSISTDERYTYQVTAVDQSCNQGSKSSSVTVTAMPNGTAVQQKPESIALPCEEAAALMSIEAEDQFTETISLREGTNEIRVVARDVAGNTDEAGGTVFYDLNPPEFLYTNIIELSPTYISEVKIRGNMSEWAEIYIYINNDTSPEYTTATDNTGYFEQEVRLRREFEYGYYGGTYSAEADFESGNAWDNRITIVAMDRGGQNSSIEDVIIYALCGYGTHWRVSVGDATPEILNPRYLLEGYATIGLDVSLEWRGPGDDEEATITSTPMITIQPMNAETAEDYDEEWLGHVDTSYSDDYENLYFLIDVNSPYGAEAAGNTTLEQEENLSKHRLDDCALPGYGCVKLPLMLRIDYSYKDPHNKSDFTARTQRQCWDVEVAIDRRFPSDKVPEELLESLIEILENVIDLIDHVLKPLKELKKWIFVACMGSWVIWWLKKASEWSSCVSSDPMNLIDPATCRTDTGGEQAETCRSCLEARANTIKFWETKVQWLCDRIMCPSAPSIQKYIRDAKAEARRTGSDRKYSHCMLKNTEPDYTVSRNDEMWDECSQPEMVEVRFPTAQGADPWGAPDPDCCEVEYLRQWDSACMGMNELKESFCITSPLPSEEAAAGVTCGTVQGFMRNLGSICDKTAKGRTVIVDNPTGRSPRYYLVDEYTPELAQEQEGYAAGDRLAAWEVDYVGLYEERVPEEGEEAAEPAQATGTTIPGAIEVPEDREDYIIKKTAQPILDPSGCRRKSSETGLEEMLSYQENTAYSSATSPTYIPAVVYELVCAEAADYVVDPTAGLWRSFQCVCLTSMTAYLEHWKKILTMVKNCFQQILYTGDGSAGICKQVLSIYLCDLIYYAIKCISEGAGKGYGGQVRGGLTGFMSYVSNSGEDVQHSVRGRYGESTIYQTMFVDRKLMHAVCLFAFTGDWDLDLDTLLEEEISVPIETTCVLTGTRRFQHKNPQLQGYATFMYHLGIFIVSGAEDMIYEAKLVCSGDNSCDTDIDSAGRCDCMRNNQGEQEYMLAVGDGELQQGEVLNEEFFEEITEPYRYDKLVVEVSYTDNSGQEVTKECGSVNIGRVGGDPPVDCSFDIAELTFHCRYEWGDYGYAYFDDLELVRSDHLCLGDSMETEGTIFKQSATSESPENMYLFYHLYREGSGRSLAGPAYVKLSKDGEYDLQDDSDFQGGFPPNVEVEENWFETDPEPRWETNLGQATGLSVSFENKQKLDHKIEILFTKRYEDEFSYKVTQGEDELEDEAEDREGEYDPEEGIKLEFRSGFVLIVEGLAVDDEDKETERLTLVEPGGWEFDNDFRMDVSLHYEDRDSGKPDSAPIEYNGELQEDTLTFTAFSKKDCYEGSGAEEGACIYDGTREEPDDCDCNLDGRIGTAPQDCQGSYMYCYEESDGDLLCHRQPACETGEDDRNDEACDCDMDGDADDAVDCDGEERQYCVRGACYAEEDIPEEDDPPKVSLRGINFYGQGSGPAKRDDSYYIVEVGKRYDLMVKITDDIGIQRVLLDTEELKEFDKPTSNTIFEGPLSWTANTGVLAQTGPVRVPLIVVDSGGNQAETDVLLYRQR